MTVVNDVLGQLGKMKGAAFANITYRAKGTKELAKCHIVLGASTEVLYQKDLEILNALLPTLDGLHKVACEKIISSRMESLLGGVGHNSEYVHSPENADTYVYPDGLAGVRVHKDNGTVYVNGLIQHKTVIEPGVYREVKSAPLTVAKKEIEKGLPSSKFRQYIIKRIRRCAAVGTVVEADTMEIEAIDDADGI